MTYLGDDQMLRILDRGHSVPTVTELIFVRAQCFTNFGTKAFCTLRNNNWIQLLFPKEQNAFVAKLVKHCLDPVIVPQSAKCFCSKIGKALRSHSMNKSLMEYMRKEYDNLTLVAIWNKLSTWFSTVERSFQEYNLQW